MVSTQRTPISVDGAENGLVYVLSDNDGRKNIATYCTEFRLVFGVLAQLSRWRSLWLYFFYGLKPDVIYGKTTALGHQVPDDRRPKLGNGPLWRRIAT